jgi:hypothetical protein
MTNNEKTVMLNLALEVLGVGGVSGTSNGLAVELLRETAVELCEVVGVEPGVCPLGGAGAFFCLDFCTARACQSVLLSKRMKSEKEKEF